MKTRWYRCDQLISFIVAVVVIVFVLCRLSPSSLLLLSLSLFLPSCCCCRHRRFFCWCCQHVVVVVVVILAIGKDRDSAVNPSVFFSHDLFFVSLTRSLTKRVKQKKSIFRWWLRSTGFGVDAYDRDQRERTK